MTLIQLINELVQLSMRVSKDTPVFVWDTESDSWEAAEPRYYNDPVEDEEYPIGRIIFGCPDTDMADYIIDVQERGRLNG